MASPADSNVASAQPGILQNGDGGNLLPTLPQPPPLPTLDQVLPVNIQLPLWSPRFVSSSPFLKPTYHKVKMKKPPIFRTYNLTPVHNDVYNLSSDRLYLSHQVSTNVNEALLADESCGDAISVENPQNVTETQGTLSEFIRTSFPHLDNHCLENFSPILFENHSGHSNTPSPLLETDNPLIDNKAGNIVTVDSTADISTQEADHNDSSITSRSSTPIAPPSTPTISPLPPTLPTLTIPSTALTPTLSSPGLQLTFLSLLQPRLYLTFPRP